MAGASRTSAAAAGTAMAANYAGPHEMPTNVTLLSMRNADGSETLGVKLGTVRSRIHRGRAQLRAALDHRRPRRAAEAKASPTPALRSDTA